MSKSKRKVGDPLPDAIRDAALKRVAAGEKPTHVARSMGLHPATVLRWGKKFNVKVGDALSPEVSALVTQPDEMMSKFELELKNQNVNAALAMFLDMQDGVEDKYRVLMAQQLYNVFHTVMQNPPPIRNWADVERAHKIMERILNPTAGKTGGGRAKIDIQFNVAGAKPQVIDAEVIDEDSGD